LLFFVHFLLTAIVVFLVAQNCIFRSIEQNVSRKSIEVSEIGLKFGFMVGAGCFGPRNGVVARKRWKIGCFARVLRAVVTFIHSIISFFEALAVLNKLCIVCILSCFEPAAPQESEGSPFKQSGGGFILRPRATRRDSLCMHSRRTVFF
jgi:hypothetical protein